MTIEQQIYLWVLCALSTFLFLTKINREFFKQELKDTSGKDWIYISVITTLFPVGILIVLYHICKQHQMGSKLGKIGRFFLQDINVIWSNFISGISFLRKK